MVDLCLGMSVQDPGTNHLSTASVNILMEWLAQYFMKFDRRSVRILRPYWTPVLVESQIFQSLIGTSHVVNKLLLISILRPSHETETLTYFFKVQLTKRNQKRRVFNMIRWHFHQLQPLLQVSSLRYVSAHHIFNLLTLKPQNVLKACAASRWNHWDHVSSWAVEYNSELYVILNSSYILKQQYILNVSNLTSYCLENFQHESQNLMAPMLLLAGEQALREVKIFVR